MKHLVTVLFFCLLYLMQARAQTPVEADVVIYGGTSAAITAAVQVKKMNRSVVIVSPDKHLGGLSSGGLGFTDTGNKSVIGGLAREFYHRVYLHYQQPSAWNWQPQSEYGNKGQGTPAMDGSERTMWIFEPHVAEQVFEDFVKENNIKIYRDEWLDRDKGVTKKGQKIIAIKTLSGKTFRGKMFIDATYEGDLMAAAKVSYRVGREANSEYNETWNGVQTGVFHHGHYFKKPVSAYKVPGDANSGLLPLISSQPPGEKGSGDKRIQAYCFRMCLTDLPANRIPFVRPEGYDSTQYELLVRVFKNGWEEAFNKYDPIPNHKTDVNNHGPFSTDYIGMNYDYPDASYEKRKEIIAAHATYQKGLLYFMATDPRVPDDIRTHMNKWGLSGDEFKDNGNWPHQLYIREARRMAGMETMTEHEVLGKKQAANPVGMGSYTLDSHNTQRYVQEDGTVQNEGDVGIHVPEPYRISYGAIVPKKGECENLLVPVCVSCTHIAYGSIRMEPVFMILGQSAATAAIQAIDAKKAVQDINYGQLKAQLLKDKQRL
ncbi:FAD-dependent oxidoreductase [Chitinophaga sp. CF418]|uniref:FAD-dependent oxidoreductase n=1 Tax=Chitinophaga sp. CF418 TaxID=1855287 RepID=UPI0009195A66|nr:FAD-dependent oxidoreductase [Chitinophaga sp. CF418]SHN45238.1 FAD dependent oxidoreductase [Chitinophaga sp. CF418]